MGRKYGKIFTATKGKHKGKKVKYSYSNMKGAGKRMVLHYPKKRR
jgi:hypothetical protein